MTLDVIVGLALAISLGLIAGAIYAAGEAISKSIDELPGRQAYLLDVLLARPLGEYRDKFRPERPAARRDG